MTTMAVASSDTEIVDALMVSNEVSTPSLQWILDSIRSHHICCRDELFKSLENSEGTVYLSDGSSL